MDSDSAARPMAGERAPEDEFAAMYEANKADIFNFCCYLAADRAEAEDVFQEVWLRVVRNFAEMPSRTNLKPWVLTIALNVHRDMLRRKRVRRLFLAIKRSEAHAEGYKSSASGTSSEDPALSAERAALRRSIQRAVAGLPARQRRVFVLKEIEGLAQAEISDLMKIPLGTVKSLMHRAVKRLQKELAGHRTQVKRDQCDVKILSV
ncbi:MAG: RNA polymerase sigma factor [Acidobacteriota bacterium]